ncbi:MAG TPA: DNA translocase FtsK [bacterium]|nr:DNA translocase FtsK [bacterium]
MRKDRINEIWGVLFLLLGLFTLASLVFFHPEDVSFYTSDPSNPTLNYTGVIGAYVSFGLLLTFGVSALIVPVLFLLWSGCFFLQRVPERKFFKWVGLAIALFSTATMVAISVDPADRFSQGGAVGYLAGSHLLRYFGTMGSYIVAGSCLLLSLLLATDFLIYPLVKSLVEKIQDTTSAVLEKIAPIGHFFGNLLDGWAGRREEKVSLKAQKARVSKEPVQKPLAPNPLLANIPLKVKQYRPDLAESREESLPAVKSDGKEERPAKGSAPQEKVPFLEKVFKPKTEKRDKETEKTSPAKPEASEPRFEGVIGSKRPVEGDYAFPSLDLLRRASRDAAKEDNLQGNIRILEQTLAHFNIEVKVVEVEQGPVITRYELLPAPGVKVSSIESLSDDLALALKAKSIRLIVPIPGKSAIGVEVPNSVSSVVTLREMIESREFQSRKCQLPLVLGKDTSGRPLIADLANMPHILIAGSTGSGKTVCVNSIIMGLLYYATPEDLKFVMVDPKMVELAVYNKIPHMLTPVVTETKKAAQTLNWIVTEMENRYRLFATCGVRNIQSFNNRPISEEALQAMESVESENVTPARLPYIVVVIDELADLMIAAQDKVEAAIMRLAQLARAVGIHLILATQRPSVDVITGVIKANFPARLSFKVASKTDSRTVLDTNGADALIGRGDMLFLQPGDAKPVRGQASLVTDEEINAVVKFVSEQRKAEYHPEMQAIQEGKTPRGVEEKDELFDEAVAIVLETGQASTSNLQRRLRLGYTRAARIIDQMEAEGMIGPVQGAKPRDIYIDRNSAPQPQPAQTAE